MRAGTYLIGLVVAASATTAPASAHRIAPDAIGRDAVRLPNGLYRVVLGDGTVLHTHGPDPLTDLDGGSVAGEPERDPVCALDFHQHVLYGRLVGSQDRLPAVKESILASIRRMNALLNEESLAAGDREADYKVKCDATGEIQVDAFTAEAADFNSVVTGARLAGFVAPNADYTIFFDESIPGACGIASLLADETHEPNLNNLGGGYAVTYRRCWNGRTPMHENGHNQGATQALAPYSTGFGHHCYDVSDIMCYSPDGGDLNQMGTLPRCTDRAHFDCGHDTYFDPAPEHGEYLESHWNLGSPVNRFISFGPPLARPPSAAFVPSCSNLDCTFFDRSTDGGAITWAWEFGDGTESSVQNPWHRYGDPGTYAVTLTVADEGSLASTIRQAVTVPVATDPDPGVPTLVNGVNWVDRNGADGTWLFYKVLVPAGRPSITVTLLGQPCVLALCYPNLDLYLKHGARPDFSHHDCASVSQRDDEVCSIASQEGYWYIGVYTRETILSAALGSSSAPFTITPRF